MLRNGPYRFFFYSHETNEPAHIRVGRDRSSAKFWLDPVTLACNSGFSRSEIRRIQRVVRDREREFMAAWDAWFEP